VRLQFVAVPTIPICSMLHGHDHCLTPVIEKIDAAAHLQ